MSDAKRGSEHEEPLYGIAPPRFRLPCAARLGAVRLQVADLDRSLNFYQQVLGFQVAMRGNGRAVLAAHESGTPLIELHEHRGASPVPPRGRLGLYHYAILLPDRAALGRFAAHLAEVGVRAGAADHLVSEALYLQDPDGLGIEVYADRPRSEWRHAQGELLMATDPLDLGELVRAAAGGPWRGMPVGTFIGHVHLHVADLESAANFYHDALGFHKTVWSYPGALFLSAGGYHHHLGVNVWAAHAAPAGEGDARLLEWELFLPSVRDAEHALASMEAAGFPVNRTADGGTVRDPAGVQLRLRGGADAA